MKKIYNLLAFWTICLLLFSSMFVACNSDDDLSTDQYKGGISLNSYGPVPVARGGILRFIGSNLDKVESIDIPGCASITDINIVSSGSHSEIRITLPVDGPEEGYVTLNLSDGSTITTQTLLIYSEPISFESLSSLTVKAGDELTITGDYLNLITKIVFADEVIVPETEFTSHSRYEIKVIVPVNARTGLVSIANDVISGTDTIPNEIPYEEELNVSVPEAELSATKVKAGDELTITGSLLRLVEYVKFPGVDAINVAQEDPTQDISEIKVIVPNGTISGAVSLQLLSGEEVEAESIQVAVPYAYMLAGESTYGVGQSVVLKGENLDLIKSIAFAGIENVEFIQNKNDEGEIESISVEVVAAAITGDMTYTALNDSTYTITGFVTTKPNVTLPASVTPLSETEFTSTLGSRVKTIKFGDLEAETTVSENGFKATIPLDAETGTVSVVMDNGEIVEIGSVTVNAITYCVITEFAAENTTVGQLLACTVKNGTTLSNVQLNGVDAKYLLVGTTLYVAMGIKTGDNELTIVSLDGTKVPYTVQVVASGVVENVIWSDGPLLITWNDGDRVIIPATSFEEIPSGSTLRLYFTDNNSAWGQAQINDGSWARISFSEVLAANEGTDKDGDPTFIPSNVTDFDWWNTEKSGTERYFDMKLTSSVLEQLITNNGMVIQGSDMIFSKVSILIDYSAPKSCVANGTWGDNESWTFPVSMSWASGGRFAIFKTTPLDLSSIVKVGATMYIYASGTGQIQINNANWGSIETVAEWSEAGDHVFEVPITQDYVDAFNNGDGWSDCWLFLQGDGFTVSDVRIK